MTVASQPNRLKGLPNLTDYRRMWKGLREGILFGGNWNGAVSTWHPVVGCIIGSDVTCGACIIGEQRVEDQQFRPVQKVWDVMWMWAAYIALRGRRCGRGF